MSTAKSASETILVVDDEEAIRRLLQRTLSREGYLCEEAPDAWQAIEELHRNAFDLVLLDIKMPGKTGVELLPEIKASYPDTAVIMVTATAEIDVAIQCMKQGAYDFVTKPFNLDDVLLNVRRALEKRRLELEVREYRQHLEEKVAEQAEKIRASFLNAIRALAYALEAKDSYTSGHSQRVAEISSTIASELGLSEEDIDKVVLAGLVHDIGKIGVKESILNKPGRLTNDELQQVQQHPEIGEHILSPVAGNEDILQFIRNHHAHFDGTGYPDRLKGLHIPLGTRILAVADAYEAMTSERPYRKAMSDEAACAELERGKETQFDPEVVDAFLRCKKDGWRKG
ncbi:MAG: response regulator [Chloroflexi bacterium]|nr:response regulator [Chloroflexota bacterium]